jgi:hypothetical protein
VCVRMFACVVCIYVCVSASLSKIYHFSEGPLQWPSPGPTAGLCMLSAGNLTTADNELPNWFANSDVKYYRRRAASSWKLKQPSSRLHTLLGSQIFLEPLQDWVGPNPTLLTLSLSRVSSGVGTTTWPPRFLKASEKTKDSSPEGLDPTIML